MKNIKTKLFLKIVSIIILLLDFAFFIVGDIYLWSDKNNAIDIIIISLLALLTGTASGLILLKKDRMAFYASTMLSIIWWGLFFGRLLPNEIEAGNLDPGYTVIDTFMISFWAAMGLGYLMVNIVAFKNWKCDNK